MTRQAIGCRVIVQETFYRLRFLMKATFFIGLSLVEALFCTAAEVQPTIEPAADRVLRAACGYLAEAAHFSIVAEVWRDQVEESGQKIQFTRTIDLRVKRPNRFHLEIHSPNTERTFWCDGRTLTQLDCKQNLFSSMKIPGTIDGAVDAAREEFGIDLPLIDLAVSDPYKNATAKVQKGTYYGLAPAMGFECHHLAFTQENVDWQVWIEKGPQPLIRKFVITHKNEPGGPEFTALIKAWDFLNRIADSDFVFEAPPGCMQVEARKTESSGATPRRNRSSTTIISPKQKS